MTRRERLERKVEKRREWAEGRRDKASAAFRVGDEHRDANGRMDWALVTQPGHIPERARINRAHDRGHEHVQMAAHHESKADGLERQLEGAIFSDDPDAVEALTAKAEALEAEAERMAAANRAFRKLKEGGEESRLLEMVNGGHLTKGEALKVVDLWRVCPYHRGALYPSYQLSNTRANARRARERIKVVQARAERSAAAEAAPGGVMVEGGEAPHYWCRVTFAEKPAREVLNALKAAGYRWGGGHWAGDIRKLPAEVRA